MSDQTIPLRYEITVRDDAQAAMERTIATAERMNESFLKVQRDQRTASDAIKRTAEEVARASAEAAAKASAEAAAKKAAAETAATSANSLKEKMFGVEKATAGANAALVLLGRQGTPAIAALSNAMSGFIVNGVGPWGLAIGGATALLGLFISSQRDAAKASAEHTAALAKQADQWKRLDELRAATTAATLKFGASRVNSSADQLGTEVRIAEERDRLTSAQSEFDRLVAGGMSTTARGAVPDGLRREIADARRQILVLSAELEEMRRGAAAERAPSLLDPKREAELSAEVRSLLRDSRMTFMNRVRADPVLGGQMRAGEDERRREWEADLVRIADEATADQEAAKKAAEAAAESVMRWKIEGEEQIARAWADALMGESAEVTGRKLSESETATQRWKEREAAAAKERERIAADRIDRVVALEQGAAERVLAITGTTTERELAALQNRYDREIDALREKHATAAEIERVEAARRAEQAALLTPSVSRSRRDLDERARAALDNPESGYGDGAQAAILQIQSRVQTSAELGAAATNAFADAFVRLGDNATSGTMKAGEALKGFARDAVGALRQIATQQLALSLFGAIFGGAAQGAGAATSPENVAAYEAAYNARVTYAEGGVAMRPSTFGEAGPEAAVPLSRGRKIPVELLSAPTRGGDVHIHHHHTWHVQALDARSVAAVLADSQDTIAAITADSLNKDARIRTAVRNAARG